MTNSIRLGKLSAILRSKGKKPSSMRGKIDTIGGIITMKRNSD